MREPEFWWRPDGLTSRLLSPLGLLFGTIAGVRLRQSGTAAGIPVICIGNLTLGGAGKTPTAILVAQILTAAGRNPFLLSRGYGGALPGPVHVDAVHHRAYDVGDEPLLLAVSAPTIVARDRAAGAAAARAAGAKSIVMDDGFQSPNLKKNLSILVVDGQRGIGNGRVFPAGPLRAQLHAQLSRAQAMLVIGRGEAGESLASAARAHGLQIFHGRLEPDAAAIAKLKGKPVMAFAGIGHPPKFFRTLRDAGIDVRVEIAFADHHRFGRDEAVELMARAEREGLSPATTAKDLTRMSGDPDLALLAAAVIAIPVRLEVEEPEKFKTLVVSVGY
jgi:tetraacyldisaccharide 4'-kinase